MLSVLFDHVVGERAAGACLVWRSPGGPPASDLKTGVVPPCGAHPTSPNPDSLRWFGEVGRMWADSGSHEVDDTNGAVLLLEGASRLYPLPPCFSYLR
jgi:hypothetical protein